jgi:23S rRNA (adenine2503-C2)-methyltransferase
MNIIGITREELARDFERFGLEKYRADQVQLWLYNKGATEFDQMINLPKDLRKKLNEKYIISTGEVVKDTLSNDGTRKWLINFGGQEVETVFIPESTRGTLCVSSQVGCSMSCTFCHTGTQPLVRNLKAGEIIGQLMTAKRALFDFPTAQDKVVSNIVFMGQGEPFYNYRNVSSAIRVMTDPNCFSMSKRRLTVSTSGIVPNIMKLGEDFHGINLAISLHAVRDDLRSEIVPANKQWPIAEVIEACRKFPGSHDSHRKITFEYVMLKGVNDSDDEARELVGLIKEFSCIVNLIPFNPWPGSKYESSSKDRIIKFAKIIEDGGIGAPIRWPRGRDILAACGQLKTATIKERQQLASQ